MILGIGIDSVDIERVTHWHNFRAKSLSKIFTQNELSYCLSNPAKRAERFAARFALKEACYKALSSLLDNRTFFETARHIEVIKEENGACTISLNFAQEKTIHLKIHNSVTHTDSTATAFVIVESE